MIRTSVAQALRRKQKRDDDARRRRRLALIVLLSVLGFLTFSLLVVTGIFFFVLRPAYRTLLEFINALNESDYLPDYDDE